MSHLTEFEIIKRYFVPQSVKRADVCIGIGDDAAITSVPKEHKLVTAVDTLIAGVHFPLKTKAYDIAYKALAVNLSDLAAMGAMPAWATLALTLPDATDAWLKEFAAGFFYLAKQHSVQLIGGDLTQGSLSITIQVQGFVPEGKGLTRAGAQVGDCIVVTGTLGDAGMGLALLKQGKPDEYLTQRLNQPEARVKAGMQLLDLDIANAAIDISDGLVADLQHILTASDVGAEVCIDDLPLSVAMLKHNSKEQAWQYACSSGDDYELCFTMSKDKLKQLEQLDCQCTVIGKIVKNKGLMFKNANDQIVEVKQAGYRHF